MGLKGRGFLGGLGLCGVGGALEWATECSTTLVPRGPVLGDEVALKGRTMFTGWVSLDAGPGLRGRTSLLV